MIGTCTKWYSITNKLKGLHVQPTNTDHFLIGAAQLHSPRPDSIPARIQHPPTTNISCWRARVTFQNTDISDLLGMMILSLPGHEVPSVILNITTKAPTIQTRRLYKRYFHFHHTFILSPLVFASLYTSLSNGRRRRPTCFQLKCWCRQLTPCNLTRRPEPVAWPALGRRS